MKKTTPEETALEEEIAFALSMTPDMPCIFSTTVDDCTRTATWVGYLAPQAEECTQPTTAPLCDKHKRALERMSRLSAWPGCEAPPCESCGAPTQFNRFEPIKGN